MIVSDQIPLLYILIGCVVVEILHFAGRVLRYEPGEPSS